MTQPAEFKSRGRFVLWIKDIIARRRKGELTNHVLSIGYNPLSYRLSAALTSATEYPDWCKYRHDIPRTLVAAKDIWDTIHERYLCLHFVHRMPLGRIVVGARKGIWDSLPDGILPHPRSSFTKVSDEDAMRLLGDRHEFSAMVFEVYLFGISCRILQ